MKNLRPELELLDLLVKAIRPIRRSPDPETARVAAHYEIKFSRRLAKLTTQKPSQN